MVNATKDQILFVLNSLRGGGAERVVLHILRHMGRENFTPMLVLLTGQGDYANMVPPDLRIYDFQAKQARDALIPLSKLIRKVRPALIFSTAVHVDEIVNAAIRLARHSPKLILRCSNFPSINLQRAPSPVRWLARWSYAQADRIVALTQAMKEDLQNFFGISPERIYVIPNPVDLELIRSLRHEPVDHPWFQERERRTHPIIAVMGSLTEQKGFSYLIQAFASIAAEIPVRLILLGRGRKQAELEALAQELGVSDRTLFLGFQRNPFKYLSKADVFVLSSLWEGFPNALLEAMACGVPVISTSCPSGPAEIITHGVDGLLVPPRSSKDLAEALLKVLRDKKLAKDLAIAAEQKANEFEVSRIVRQYEELFQHVARLEGELL